MGRKLFVAVVCILAASLNGAARADITNSTATNVEEGNNSAHTGQRGGSTSGDAVGGQVGGVVSSGRTSVDARNTSANSSVESGEVAGTNSASSFTGQSASNGNIAVGADVINIGSRAVNVMEGDNRTTIDQATTASSGDGVAGQVIGAVTAAGGSNSIVADNVSDGVDAFTGDSDASSHAASLTGQNKCRGGTVAITSDIINPGFRSCNVQEGDNRTSARQTTGATTGDAVAGEVIGSVSAGSASIDARNRSTNSDVATGDADADASFSGFAGQNACGGNGADLIVTADIVNARHACGVQEGNNTIAGSERTAASTGDGVGGQVIGTVTSAGGATSVVADNGSANVAVDTGDADATDATAAFAGQSSCGGESLVIASDVIDPDTCDVQEGNNRFTSSQSATAATGDGVAGEVIGVVSAGRTSIDARNRSSDSDATTGDADAADSVSGFVGQDNCGGGDESITADLVNIAACQAQEGDNRLTDNQRTAATTGDAVAGGVIGAVTAAGGSNSIVADNASTDVSAETGDADAIAAAAAFVGQQNCGGEDEVIGADIIGGVFNNCNVQEGDNRLTNSQNATASTGDGVAGQVIGSVAAGATSIDARNRSSSTDVTTGDADASDALGAFVGQVECGGSGELTITDITDLAACNVQEGSNRLTNTQNAAATTGDGVGGQVIGAVTSAGASASIVALNATTNSSIETGDADASNEAVAFVGQDDAGATILAADISGFCKEAFSFCDNLQDGNNRLVLSQTAVAETGDGVGGQVLGVVSAGAASLDATNRSDDNAITTGDAHASNVADEFVGQSNSEFFALGSPTVMDVTGSFADNIQDGNNSRTLAQSANAASGDAVAGQVSGIVTSAGGSASVVVANASIAIDATTGDSVFDNSDAAFVGLSFVAGSIVIG